MVVTAESVPEPDTLRFELLTVRDEPSSLTLQLPDGALPEVGEPPDWREYVRADDVLEAQATARVSRFGDARRERALLDTLELRLRALEKGDGSAPAATN